MMTVEWSEPAEIDYWKNIQYLENEWTLKEVHNFMDKVDELIDLLEKGNVTFKPTDYKDTFQVPVVKQITLYYRVADNKVELLRFWNNYQDLANFSL
jgi:plasmid stabilization system protein ParE